MVSVSVGKNVDSVMLEVVTVMVVRVKGTVGGMPVAVGLA